MSEERTVPNPATLSEQDGQNPAPDNAAIDVGQSLRLAREARGISIDEASMALKLSPRQIEALETNYRLPLPRTVTRGFVRNYARYLEFDAGSLMAAMDSVPAPQEPELAVSVGAPVNMPREGRGDGRDYVRVLAGAIILVLALLAYFFVPAEAWRSTLDSIRTLVSAGQAEADTVVVAPAGGDPGKGSGTAPAVPKAAPAIVAPVPRTVSAPAPPFPDAAPVPEPSAATPAAPSASGGTLVFSFAQPSWVEVRDRGGQIVLSQLNPAGSQREVAGQPPFTLIVGNATHVTLQYNGKPVELSQRSKDDVARLTLE